MICFHAAYNIAHDNGLVFLIGSAAVLGWQGRILSRDLHDLPLFDFGVVMDFCVSLFLLLYSKLD